MDRFENQAQLFKVLMHPTRLAILSELRQGEQCVCHLEAKLGYRQAYISQHLMLMRDSGLVIDRREGWNVFYSVCIPEIYQVIDAMNCLTQTESEETSPTYSESSGNQHACPCPKCNPGEQPSQHKQADLPVLRAETAI